MTGAKCVSAMAWGLGLGLCVTQSTATAGGYDTGERDWDALFITSETIAVETQVRHIMPDRVLSNVTSVAPVSTITTAPEAEAFTIFRATATGRAGDYLRCMTSFRQPWEGHANYGSAWIAAAAVIEQHFSSQDYGLTCAGTHQIEIGQLSVLGGVSYQQARFELTQAVPNTMVAPPFPVIGQTLTDVDDWSWAWRVGLAYEIPEYALRASLIYNSQVDYNMSGTVTSPIYGGTVSTSGSISMPRSIELKAQSGVAPGWLAFGSLRWTDWSVADAMILTSPGLGQVSGLELQWQDSWTVTAGAVHQINEQLALTGSLTWDQGATNGFTPQTDTWVGALNAVFDPNDHAQLVVGGSAGLMTSGSYSTATLTNGNPNPLGYSATFGTDWVLALNASVKISF